MRFNSSCYFYDASGASHSCDQGLTEEVKDVPYNFPIEFVTSNRKVLNSFTLGKLFFMFDDQSNIIVQRLPLYSKTLDDVNGQTLIRIATLSQEEKLGCDVNGGYMEAFDISSFPDIKELIKPGQKRVPEAWYLLFY